MGIKAARCDLCGKVIIPPRRICPYCGPGAGETTSLDMDGHGSVLSYTVLEVAPEGFKPPILMALVEIEQSAVVLSTGRKDDIESIRIGAPVELESGPDGRLSFTILT